MYVTPSSLFLFTSFPCILRIPTDAQYQANILISDHGEPLLCDFGLAVILEDLAQMPISSLLQDAGNPRWMAPELLIGEQQVSTASDIWALGMVLLEVRLYSSSEEIYIYQSHTGSYGVDNELRYSVP